jgi:hypothetical protein
VTPVDLYRVAKLLEEAGAGLQQRLQQKETGGSFAARALQLLVAVPVTASGA